MDDQGKSRFNNVNTGDFKVKPSKGNIFSPYRSIILFSRFSLLGIAQHSEAEGPEQYPFG